VSHHFRRLLWRPWVGVPAREAQHRAVTAVPPSLPFLFLLSSPFLFPSLYFFLLSFCSLLILLSQYLRPRPGAGVRERSTGLLPKTPFHSPPFTPLLDDLSDVKPPEPLGARRTVSRLVLGPKDPSRTCVRQRGVAKGREYNEADTEAAREEVLRILVLQEERKDGDKAQ